MWKLSRGHLYCRRTGHLLVSPSLSSSLVPSLTPDITVFPERRFLPVPARRAPTRWQSRVTATEPALPGEICRWWPRQSVLILLIFSDDGTYASAGLLRLQVGFLLPANAFTSQAPVLRA